ncbi:amino acid transporter [Pholiota conissans]|uniref:Amino acid transporter n=1 Tax=Pholiota conissans TaxID=109636 RepID=A0A9P5ZAF4_9AGAR|nr:amino acid transporter [Pholiota conissans]
MPEEMSSTSVDARSNPLEDENESMPPTATLNRHVGVVSAVFIIFNRIIGTGIFATPSTILSFSGSVGLSFVMWLVGALIAAAGMQVYIIWGTAFPRSGGEKNYLERLFPTPRRLITSIYAANAVLLAYAAGNALVFAEYTLASLTPNSSLSKASLFSPVRLVAALCLTFVLLLHGLHIPWGLRLQNTLGFLKLLILFIVVITGVFALSGHLEGDVERPGNFDSWTRIWEGTQTGGSVVCACLYNVIWSYVGFSNANYALSEMHNPGRTLRIAGPLALITVTFFYLLCNVAYYAAASKGEIVGSGRLVAALLFRNVWGERAERVLSAFVALSALGNVLSVSFSQGRVNQELGKEGVLPLSNFWKSDWPANAPLAGLGLHWLVCNIVIFALPEGDAYNFVLNVISYPLAVINATISLGLIYLVFRDTHFDTPLWYKYHKAEAPIDCIDESTPLLQAAATSTHSSSSATLSEPTFLPTYSLLLPALVFGIANVFLFIVPLLPPPRGVEPYKHLPYWTHALGGWAVFLIGAAWWTLRERRRI